LLTVLWGRALLFLDYVDGSTEYKQIAKVAGMAISGKFGDLKRCLQRGGDWGPRASRYNAYFINSSSFFLAS
jgi:hypothetical protein